MPIKAIFVDMDGTLLADNHRISEYSSRVLEQLKSTGIRFIIATGRPYPDVFATIRRCNLKPDYIITSNGGRVHDAKLNIILQHDMDPEAVRILFQLDKQPEMDGSIDDGCPPATFFINVNHEGEWLTNRCLPDIKRAFDESLDYREVDPKKYTAEMLRGTHSLWFRGEHEDLKCVDAFIKHNMEDKVLSTFSTPDVVDCVPPGVTKAHAVEEVAKLLEIDLCDIAAFGDGFNDVKMLKLAGKSFVMANATQDVKDAVPQAEVIGSNDDNGVAKKIEELFFQH